MKKYRIFLVIGGKATPGDNNNIWIRNLYDPLVTLGHDVHLFDIDDYAQRQQLGYMSVEAKERLSNELPGLFLNKHTRKPFDIFFSYLHNGQIIPEILLEIKKHVYIINYSTNYHQFEMYKDVARIVNHNIYISKMAKAGFDGLNVKSYWMPFAANPVFYKPSEEKNNSAVFIGSVYGPRPYMFWRLLQYGINLQLYGYGWSETYIPINTKYESKNLKSTIKNILKATTGYEIRKAIYNQPVALEDTLRDQYAKLNNTVLSLLRRDYPQHLHNSLNDTEYVKTLAEAGTVINIQESRFNHDYSNHRVLYGSNLRDFEATMCGSFVCTQYSSEIEELFEIDKEIVCYHNEHDLSEKINYYNKNSTERANIARAGYLRSLNCHTWQSRFKEFFSTIDL